MLVGSNFRGRGCRVQSSRQFDPIPPPFCSNPDLSAPHCNLSTYGWICVAATALEKIPRQKAALATHPVSLSLSSRFPIGITACPMFNLQSLLILSVIGIVISGDKEDMKLHNVDGCHSCKSRKDKGGKGLDKTFTIECYGNKPVSFKRF